MTTTTHAALPHKGMETLTRGIGLPGRIAVSWTLAGGLLVGGFLVALMTLAGKLSGNALLLTSTGLFLIGGVLGYLHGAALGYLGRPEGMTRGRAVAALGLAAVYALPALAVGAVVAGWIAMSAVAIYLDRLLPKVAVGFAWVLGLALVAWAAVQGWRGLSNAYARWPQRRLGTALVAGLFGALLVLFLAERPEIWGLQMRVTPVGAVLLAAMATFWLAGPMVTLALRLVEQLPRRVQAAPATPLRAGTSVAIGLAAGVVLGLVAMPFYGAPLRVMAPVVASAPLGALALALSQALVSEVLLRLFGVSAVAWLLMRRYQRRPGEAAVAAVGVGALVQVLLYLPAVIGTGFPSLALAALFVGAAVVLPALAFGILYWTRGLTCAICANATAVLLVALLAA